MPREFDYSSLTYDDRVLIHNALAATTVRHILANEGLFRPIDFDTAANPSQQLETTQLNPAPAKFEGPMGIISLATAASSNLYQAIRDELARQRAFVGIAEQDRLNGQDFINVTTHQKMIDVAEYDAAWVEATEHERWQEDSGLIISRGVTTVEAFGMAASEVAQKIGHVFMSFPRTKTIMQLVKTFKEQQIERLKDNPDAKEIDIDLLIETNNRKMRGDVRAWREIDAIHRVTKIGRHIPGKDLNVAIEGATTIVEYGDNHKPEKIILRRASKGTMDILRHARSVPIVLWDQDDPIVEIGEPREVKTDQDVADIQEWQRRKLAERLELPDEAVTIERLAA